MDYLVIASLVGGCVLLLVLLFFKDAIRFIESRCIIMREFLKNNSGFFTLLFISVFFFEQLLLIILAFALEVDALAQILISIFSLIVLTTATIEKFILEKRYAYLKKESEWLILKNEMIFNEVKGLFSILRLKLKK